MNVMRWVVTLLMLLVASFASAAAFASTVQDIAVNGDAVVIRFDAPVVRASSFALAAPNRLLVDVEGALPGGTVKPGGGVLGIRQGARSGGIRIVLDLGRPMIVASGQFSADGRALTLALRAVDDAAFGVAVGAERLSFGALAVPGATRPPPPVASAPAAVKPAAPRIYGPAGRPLIVIDAGHGGLDAGAGGGVAMREKDVTLRISRTIRDELVRSGRVRVALTREDDRFLLLEDRFQIARRLGADLLISIHAGPATGETGVSAFTMAETASDRAASRYALAENKSDIVAGVDLAVRTPTLDSILIDLTRRETLKTSTTFVRVLQGETTALVVPGMAFHRHAPLRVLGAPDLPSIVLDLGNPAAPRDAAFIASADGARRVADAVRSAVEVHFARRIGSAN